MLTKRFWIGLILIIISTVMGLIKFFIIPVFALSVKAGEFFLFLYIISWPMLFIGIYLVGREGYETIKARYREHQRETIETVKKHSKKTYSKIKEGVKKLRPKK